MSKDLKRLVAEIEETFIARGDLFDAPAQEIFAAKIQALKEAVDQADTKNSAEVSQLRFEALNVLAALLSIITNVMTLLR